MAFPVGWQRKCEITLESSEVDETLTDFPCLLKRGSFPDEMFDGDGSYHCLEGGGDVRFSTDEAGTNQLPCEIEDLHLDDSSTRPNSAQVWVKVPTLSSSADTKIWVWYKKAGESQPSVTDTYGRNAVWSDYVAVYHMNEESGSTVVDSAGNHDGTYQGTLPDNIWSKIGQGQDFNGTSDYFTVADHADFDQYQDTTIQIWAESDDGGGEWRGLFTKDRETFPDSSIGIWQSNETPAHVDYRVGSQAAGDTDFGTSAARSIYLSWIENGGAIRATLDGSVDWSGTDTSSNQPANGTYAVNVGRAGGVSEFFDGVMVEARWYHGILSDGWRSTEYNNHNDNSSFTTPGTPGPTLEIEPSSIGSSEAFGSAAIVYDQSVSPTGLSSAEAFGSATVIIDQFVSPSSISSLEAFGTAQIDQQISPSGIGSSEAFGSPQIDQELSPFAIGSEEAFGTPQIDQEISPASISSSEAFGTLTITPGNVNIIPSGIGSSEAFGTPQIDMIIYPDGIASGEAFGTPALWRDVIDPEGIASEEVFGTPGILRNPIDPDGIPSAEAFGSAQIDQEISPASISSSEAFGSPEVSQDVSPSGISSEEAFGTFEIDMILYPFAIGPEEAFGSAQIDQEISPASISSSEAFGSPEVSQDVSPSGISSEEAFGTPNVMLTIGPDGIASEEALGSPQIDMIIYPASVSSSEAFGTPQIDMIIYPASVSSSEAFGTPNVMLTIGPDGIASEEALGSPQIDMIIYPASVSSSEAFGTPQIDMIIYPDGIASGEAFGTFTLNLDLFPSSIASEEAFGTPEIDLVIFPAGIASEEAIGEPDVWAQPVLSPTGIPSGEAFGTFTITLYMGPSGIASAEAIGSHEIYRRVLDSFEQMVQDDLSDVFINDDEFAEPITYIFRTGEQLQTVAIYDNEFLALDMESGAEVMSRDPMITIPTPDFSISPDSGDHCIIRGRQYQVMDHQPDGTGISQLQLKIQRSV